MESQFYNAAPPNPSYPYYAPPHYSEKNPIPPPIYHPPPPSLHPPGVDSYHYTHEPHTLVDYYYPPPHGVPPVNAVDSLYNNSIYPVDPNSLSGYPLVDGAIPSFLKKWEASQPMRCDVCNVDCNSKDVFDRHILGKQHMRNMALQPHAGVLGIRFTPGSSVAAGEDLETKKRKLVEGGAAVDSVLTCSICNVVCNDRIVYNDHIAGKKHALQAGLMLTNTMVRAKPIPIARTNSQVQPQKNVNRKGPKKSNIVQSAWCEICGIDCNSQDVLEIHKKGKKHQKNLDKLNESKTASTSSQITMNNPEIGPQENPKKKAKKKATSAPEEDVETKRQKIVSGGAAVDEVRVCTICNVVCNSQAVFNSHLKGQKHANNVKKRAAGTTAPAVTVS